MKKVLAMILCVLMFASLAVTAFAETGTQILSDKLKEEVAAFNVAAKAAVKEVNDAAKANQASYENDIKAWKADLEYIAGVKTYNEEVRLDIAGMTVVGNAFAQALITQLGVTNAINAYDKWLNDVESANSFAKTTQDIADAFWKANDQAYAAFAAEQEALMAVATAEFNALSDAMDVAIAGFQG